MSMIGFDGSGLRVLVCGNGVRSPIPNVFRLFAVLIDRWSLRAFSDSCRQIKWCFVKTGRSPRYNSRLNIDPFSFTLLIAVVFESLFQIPA
jgi:hypothetical protein